MNDLKFALRQLLKNPGFTAVALLTLALGIGANTVVFSVARTVLFRPLGFEGEDRLMWIRRVNTQTGANENPLSWQDLEDIRAATQSFESVATDNSHDGNWEDGDRSEKVAVVRATPTLPDMLRLRPVLGRMFLASDAEAGAEPVALISHELWHARFGGSPDALGENVRLDKIARTIVGVLPPGVHPHCYYPYGQYPMQNPVLAVRVTGNPAAFTPILRREIRAVAPSLPEPVIQTMGPIFARTMAQPRFQAWMLTLFGAVALVLAAVGLYGVLAYTVAQRRREIGVRMALGAQRPVVLGLVIGQGMRLAIIGVLLGLMGAFALTRVMQSLLYEVKATDPLTFAAVPLLLLSIALLACWLPARRATRVNPIEALRYE